MAEFSYGDMSRLRMTSGFNFSPVVTMHRVDDLGVKMWLMHGRSLRCLIRGWSCKPSVLASAYNTVLLEVKPSE